MIHGIVICPDESMSERLCGMLVSSGRVEIKRTIATYPQPSDLVRTLRALDANALFLSFSSVEAVSSLVRQIEHDVPGVSVIAFHQSMDPLVLRESMRLGIREFLTEPLERDVVMETIENLIDRMEKQPTQAGLTDQIFSFLPAKAGTGSSTVALNTSSAISSLPGSPVLLSDFDLNSGMLRFMMKLGNTYSVIDAIESSARMDENLWSDLVTVRGNLHLLHAGRIRPNHRIEPGQIPELVGFMRRTYRALCFDLSGNLERYSVELMMESKRIILVCTPEVPCLHVAREKLTFLRELDLADRTVAVLNRVSRNSLLSVKQVEDLLGIPVVHCFPNDYVGVHRALSDGTEVSLATETGRSFVEFAATLVPQGPPTMESAKHSLLGKWVSHVRTPATAV